MWAPFRNGPSLIRLPLLPKQFLNIKPLVYANFFATAIVSCKALRKVFLNGTTLALLRLKINLLVNNIQ